MKIFECPWLKIALFIKVELNEMDVKVRYDDQGQFVDEAVQMFFKGLITYIVLTPCM